MKGEACLLLADTSDCYAFTVTGIADYSDENQTIHIYPNPVQDALYVKSTGEQKRRKISLAAVSGKEIKLWKNWNTKEVKLDVKSITPGIYLLKVFSDDAGKTFKLIKQ